jgi:Cu-Zn family superoxide dismutase
MENVMKATLLAVAFGICAVASACKKEGKKGAEETGTSKDAKTSAKRPEGSKPAQPDRGNQPIAPSAEKGAAGATVLIDPGAEAPTPVERAVAVLEPTKGSKAMAKIRFEKADKGLKVKVEATGLPPGKHAYHVHLLGDCTSEDGNSAGTHFNFDGASKKPPADHPHITGDLGDLEADKDGKASAEATIEKASLQGPYSILGRSVVIHEKPNDPKSPPMGAAGARLACGVIGITEPPASAP